jgi:hypothetical protein
MAGSIVSVSASRCGDMNPNGSEWLYVAALHNVTGMGPLICRLLIYTGIMCSTTACVSVAPDEWKWAQQIAQDRRESAWVFESRVRLTRPIAPWPFVTLALNHDRITYAAVVSEDCLLLIGSQKWEFYHEDSDYLYLVDLRTGKLRVEKQLNYCVGGLFCGTSDTVAYKGWHILNANGGPKAPQTERLVLLRLPRLEVTGEIDISNLRRKEYMHSVAVGGSLVAVRDSQGSVEYCSLGRPKPGGGFEPGRLLSTEEVDHLRDDRWPSDVLSSGHDTAMISSLDWAGGELRIGPIWVSATTTESPGKETVKGDRERPGGSGKGVTH